ncbi:hypothetical protein [Hyphomicrobium sp. CS1GBMeth3]|uniref:hypothetical protein n=1 Tax=Hyphomicrobium sp. CS1GBMeth3 TaxID=1892845 RepID=UPI000A900D27|nr:hypothetical protein [Hyphomicrobium sp. CS1GBMeth3]
MSKLSRRSMLRVVAGTAVAAPVVIAEASPHPAAFPLTGDCDIELLELRRAIDAYQAAVRYEMSIEGDPGHAAAVAESDAREAVIRGLVEAIHKRKPTSMRDIALRAEALRQFFFDGHRECVGEWADRDTNGPDYCLAKLYEAAVIVTGGEQHVHQS